MNETFNHRRVNFTGNGDQVVCVRYVLCDVENQNQRSDKIERRKKKVCASPSYSLIYLSVTSQRGGAPVQSLGAQPFRNKDGGSSSMHAEDQYDAPRRVVVRFWKPRKKAR